MSEFDNVDNIPTDGPKIRPGIYKAQVVGLLDKNFMGGLLVKIERYSGNSNVAGETVSVRYMSPFYGTTSRDYVGEDPNDYNQTQKSYGMWMVPPDVGSTVLVLFANNDIKEGYWIGTIPDEFMNFSVPGLAATKFVVPDTRTTDTENVRVPVGEYNKKISAKQPDVTKIPKPEHPFAKILAEQGLLKDDIRGITTSSARRESPSMVFGISTPGITDKKGKRDKVGHTDKPVVMPVSRLGGSTFVMDDGDDKFLRKTKAGEGPMQYASTEQLETDGDVGIPHNELIRLRTRTGHQILLHNSEDLIYIGNAKGTTWIEMTSNGKIDIFADDSISIHTKNDLNIKADRDINLDAGRNVNIKAGTTAHVESSGATEIVSGTDTKITSAASSHIKSGATHLETAGKIYMNSSKNAAVAAKTLTSFSSPDEMGGSVQSIMKRVPSHEPWPHHEHLDPLKFTKDLTDRENAGVIATPSTWKSYSILTDTFEKFLPPQPEEGSNNT